MVLDVINDGAEAFRGAIPADCWHDPYMSLGYLVSELRDGVEFWGCQNDDGELVGVMGIQDKGEITLIRHAYVRTRMRRKGVGSKLLTELTRTSEKPILMGTWKAAIWAVSFYEKHGFCLVSEDEKNRLLREYWDIPDRQIETSVVLVEEGYVG